MKIKITDAGYESFTGFFGSVEFVKGVSVSDVSRIECNQLAAIVTVVDAKTNKPLGQAQVDFDNWGRGQESQRYLTRAEQKALAAEKQAQEQEQQQEQEQEQQQEQSQSDRDQETEADAGKAAETPEVVVHTRESLEAIADAKGIAGLRVIGDQLGVKSKSIPDLIEQILHAQSKGVFTPKVAE